MAQIHRGGPERDPMGCGEAREETAQPMGVCARQTALRLIQEKKRMLCMHLAALEKLEPVVAASGPELEEVLYNMLRRYEIRI